MISILCLADGRTASQQGLSSVRKLPMLVKETAGLEVCASAVRSRSSYTLTRTIKQMIGINRRSRLLFIADVERGRTAVEFIAGHPAIATLPLDLCEASGKSCGPRFLTAVCR